MSVRLMSEEDRAVLQVTFDNAVRGLRAQDYRLALNSSNHCAYRDEFGRKCAIGHSIPDDQYDPEMDSSNANARELVNKWGLGVLGVDREANANSLLLGALKDLQYQAHDRFRSWGPREPEDFEQAWATFAEDFEQAWATFAEEYGLTVPSREGA